EGARARPPGGVRLGGPGGGGRRAGPRLEGAGAGAAERRRPGEPEPAGDAGGDIGEDVAEGVLHHEHVELAGVHDDPHRDRVDEPVLTSISGYSGAISVTTRRHRREVPSTFALSAEISLLRRVPASSNARRAIGSTSSRVYTQVSKTRPSGSSPLPP